jgi:hypothetical protein
LQIFNRANRGLARSQSLFLQPGNPPFPYLKGINLTPTIHQPYTNLILLLLLAISCLLGSVCLFRRGLGVNSEREALPLPRYEAPKGFKMTASPDFARQVLMGKAVLFLKSALLLTIKRRY